MTCVTATCFGPIEEFFAFSHHKRVCLPLNRLQAPIWKKDNTPVIESSPFIDLLVKDVGGHARAMELMADLLDGPEPNISEFANNLCTSVIKQVHPSFRFAIE